MIILRNIRVFACEESFMTKIINAPIPFFDERPIDKKVDTLIIHCCAFNAPEMLEVMKERKVSSHYIIEASGKIYRPVSEKKRAWHAGISYWRGRDNLNHYSVGIELEARTMGQDNYSQKQINSLVVLARQIIKHYQIPACNVTAHSDVAPSRKPDPGKMFPWQYLAGKGIGLWYDIQDADKIRENDVAKLLATIGYDVSDLAAASYAFCRHFIPQEIALCKSIEETIENVFPADYKLPEKYLPILKACAYKYGKFNNRHD